MCIRDRACFNEDGSIKSQIMKFLGEDTIRNIGEKMGAKGGDLVLMIADKPATVARALGELRLEMARRMNMIDPDKLAFTWVTDFPMFEYNEDEKRYVAMHHPFTMPRHADLDKLESDVYKRQGNKNGDKEFDQKVAWLRQVLEWQDTSNPTELVNALKLDVFSGEVFVFTPKGDVVKLPIGSVPFCLLYTSRCV